MSSKTFSNGQSQSTSELSLPLDWELEELATRLEAAWFKAGVADLLAFLPSTQHPRFDQIAIELVCVDAELAIQSGHERSLAYYSSLLPKLLQHKPYQDRLAFELARLSAPNTSAIEYPQIGDLVEGFELLGMIGTGAFSRVYLAAEAALSRRLVVLKISTKFPGEASTLARLQHKNIVPIYSWHRHQKFHVVCMPYLGSTTLWDFLKQYRQAPSSMLGQAIVSTLNMRRSQTLADVAKSRSSEMPSQPSQHASVPHELLGLSREIPRLLATQSSHETLLWIGKELSEGLMHAHDRGVLHRDIKPANILLADDGTPMLLDFNLSLTEADVDSQADMMVGTPRYMAPEQLTRVLHHHGLPDERSDLYALGVVLYEIATGKSPFGESVATDEKALKEMLDARMRFASHLETWPKDLEPGTIDIITRLLAFDPLDRYANAKQVHEDFTRQLQHRPLKYNRNRSLAERIRKWNARHPRWSAATLVGSVLGAVLLISLTMLVLRQQKVAQLESSSWLTQLEQSQLPAQSLLARDVLPINEVQALVDSLDEKWVSLDAWRKHSTRLPKQQHSQATQLLGQLLGYRARGQLELAQRASDDGARKQLLESALSASEAAASLLNVGQDAHQTLTDLIRAQLSASPSASATLPPPKSPQQWVDETQRMVRMDVGNPWYWWNLGQRKWSTGDAQGALSAAQVANLLEPGFKNSKYLTALIQLKLNDFASAEAQLTELINTQAQSKEQSIAPEMFLNRAIARLAQRKIAEAKADLDLIAGSASRYPRIYFLREQCRRSMGDRAGADEDLKAGLACQPRDAMEWASRADAKLRLVPPDARGAVEDLKQAQRLDPVQQLVYDNLAFILAEMLNQKAEAIAALSQGIEHLPTHAGLYAARAVLQARCGQRQLALEDIRSALQLDRSPMVCYQAASALLVVSAEPSDSQQAIELLKETLRQQPSLRAMMENDKDLESIRNDDRFVTLLRSAAALQ